MAAGAFGRAALGFGRELAAEVKADRLTGLGAEIAFFAVLSLAPMLLALAAALGSIESVAGADVADRANAAITDAVREALGGEAEAIVAVIDQLFAQQSAGLLGLSVLFALYAASRGFAALVKALDVVYDVEETRGWLLTRALGLGLVLGSVLVGAVVLTMLVLGPLFGRGEEVAERLGLGSVFATSWTWARPPLVLGVLVGWALVVFHVAPNRRTPWRADLPGALATTVLWLLGGVGFRLYLELSTTGGGNAVLGTLGGLLTLLLWLYLMGLALLIGGEVNAIRHHRRVRGAASSG